jgi:hypothetical protein
MASPIPMSRKTPEKCARTTRAKESCFFFDYARRGNKISQGLLAGGITHQSLCQRARAPHAYFAAPVRGRRAVYVVRFGQASGVHGKARIDGYVLQSVQQRRPGRVPRFTGAYHHRQFTVPLCLGVRGPGIAELCSVANRVAS